ncbi:hypothetical protein FISHEDRAFT_76164 [Fistulina hepatica ATCC 64428]|uniref:Uncharacterized protein n=1 Tax=Fistulina hepatica ATCC 64428 TaxID=1128425 RepID=A0A0D7A6D1_9AGAR|nr:hypothetical protein FISHEDRAFT_76164 [Fistulina hepatica ATCC 64428]
MSFFGSRSRRVHHDNRPTGATRSTRAHGDYRFWRRNSESYRAALANPQTTKEGRKHAKHELRRRGQSTHVPLMARIKRTFGVRSTPAAT